MRRSGGGGITSTPMVIESVNFVCISNEMYKSMRWRKGGGPGDSGVPSARYPQLVESLLLCITCRTYPKVLLISQSQHQTYNGEFHARRRCLSEELTLTITTQEKLDKPVIFLLQQSWQRFSAQIQQELCLLYLWLQVNRPNYPL